MAVSQLFKHFHLICIFLILTIQKSCDGETYMFENNMGTAFEFKIHIDGGKEECYHQYIHPGSTLYMAFQVVRGGDGNAGFAVKHPNGATVLPYQWVPSTQYEEQVANPGGYYEMCIDNTFSRFASKLVSLYVNTFKRDEWDKYVTDLENVDVAVQNFTGTLRNVDERIGEMLKYQDKTRQQVTRDWYLLQSNNTYVQNWSIAQCLVILLTTTLQVFFVRKLFDIKNVTPTSKPRA